VFSLHGTTMKKQRKRLQLSKEMLRKLSPDELSIPKGGDDTDQGCIGTDTCLTTDTGNTVLLTATVVLAETVHCSLREGTCA